jgi:AcrR family transcriptional regulator
MAGYGPAKMVQTPWGDSDRLREKMLRPGPGVPREQVVKSQRERLFGAMVASVAQKGYEATTVADLLELSGVSRSAFYRHFRDKDDGLLATFDAITSIALEVIVQELGTDKPWETRARNAFDALFSLIASQPAAARICFFDVYAVGERGRQAVTATTVSLATVAEDAIGQFREDRPPEQMAYGLLGGVQAVVQSHLRRDLEGTLPGQARDLWDWALGYEAPGAPLRLTGRRPRPTDSHVAPFVAYSQPEQIIRALAAGAGERGYSAVSIAEIAARASISQATFYSHFPDKETTLLAALDSIGAQMLGVMMPAARRASDWTYGVRAAIGAMCGFLAAEPDLARLAAVEIYAAGPLALREHDRTIAQMRILLEPGQDALPNAKPVVTDAALGAIWALLYGQIVSAGAQSLPQVAPLASYIALAPFIGGAQATEVANGDGRGSLLSTPAPVDSSGRRYR